MQVLLRNSQIFVSISTIQCFEMTRDCCRYRRGSIEHENTASWMAAEWHYGNGGPEFARQIVGTVREDKVHKLTQ